MAKKEKGEKKEFEKMGDLEKGVGEKKERTEDIIKEIESFDATKTPPPGRGPPKAEEVKPEPEKVEGKEKPAKKEAKVKKEDEEGLKKELERERKKTKSLAKIIEKVSTAAPETAEKPAADVEPRLKEIESKMDEKVQSQMKEVKDAVAAIGTKVEASAKSEKGERTGTKVKDMIDKVQADTTKKISEFEETLKKMIEKIEVPKKEGGEVSKGLSAFGGRVDFKNEILEIRSSLKDLDRGINELRDETDTRITKIKEQIKVLEKMPIIEEKLEGLLEKMSPGNIEKLKKFVFSADEITGEVIPNEIEKKVTKELTPVFNDIKDVRDDIEKLSENIKTLFSEINFFRGEIKNLYKLSDYISELQKEKGKIHEKMDEKEDNLIRMVNKLEGVVKKKTGLMDEKLGEFEKTFTGKLEDEVKGCFDDLTESKFLELEDRTEKNLAVSRAKLNDMLSRFVQFKNVVDPTLSLMKEEMEKLSTKLDKLKDSQADLEEETEEMVKEMFSGLAEPRINEIREQTTKFSENVSERLDDLGSEFLQFQNVINPTLNLLKNDLSKVESKIEKLNTGQDELKGNLKEIETLRKAIGSIKEGMKSFESKQKGLENKILVLGSKLGETTDEFNNVVKQSLIDKKKLDEESKKQKERINILLKELKGS
jgi:chromosome segregation ATPase